ncbi:hypothetical protein D3C87_1681360 [compost metagenome]
MPIWEPMGVRVPLLTGAPASEAVRYMRSWNSARAFLKPGVFTLARLLEVTSMLTCWAFMPDAADQREPSILDVLSRWGTVS